MTRQEFLKRTTKIGFGILSWVVFKGCGAGSKPSPVLKTVVITLNHHHQQKTKSVLIPSGSSVLEAIKTAFTYERTAPIDDISGKTTIDGISGHWLYRVGEVIPIAYAQNYPIYTDCQITLKLF